jgi:hypothetical protein
MFDIFTTHADGTVHFIESVNCVKKAEELARRLSCLFPGEYFAYFERSEFSGQLGPPWEGLRTPPPNLGVSSLAFLV